mgnify:CR=1 FL=1
MIPSVYERLHITSGVSAVIVSLALMLIAGFAMTRLTSKLRLPNVTAYIVSGILLGPFCLDLVPRGVIDGMSFLADIALAFIAFSTGEFFRISTLKKSGAKVLVITVLEACLASALVFLVCYFPLGLDLNFSLVLGALAAAPGRRRLRSGQKRRGHRSGFHGDDDPADRREGRFCRYAPAGRRA